MAYNKFILTEPIIEYKTIHLTFMDEDENEFLVIYNDNFDGIWVKEWEVKCLNDGESLDEKDKLYNTLITLAKKTIKVMKALPLKNNTGVKCTPVQLQILVDLVISNDILTKKEYIDKEYWEKYPYMGWQNDGVGLFIKDAYTIENWISFDQFAKAIFDASEHKMQLTSDYEAILIEEGIKVGCQIITWDKYDELVKLVTLFKNDKK